VASPNPSDKETNELDGIAVPGAGAVWAVEPSPDTPDAVYSILLGVAAAGPDDAWAVGFSNGGDITRTIMQHWDGTAWSSVASPNPSDKETNELDGIAVPGAGAVWAVGNSESATLAERVCTVQLSDTGFQPGTFKTTPGTPTVWGLPESNTQPHSVTDNSGLGLFDSGPLAPGSTFSYTYVGAGTYKVLDSTTGHTGKVQVQMTAAPASGGTSTSFTITWASAVTPGAVYDVQVKRPGSSVYAAFRTGVTTLSASFTPDAGAGTYVFRAKTRAPGGGQSGWSRLQIPVS